MLLIAIFRLTTVLSNARDNSPISSFLSLPSIFVLSLPELISLTAAVSLFIGIVIILEAIYNEITNTPSVIRNMAINVDFNDSTGSSATSSGTIFIITQKFWLLALSRDTGANDTTFDKCTTVPESPDRILSEICGRYLWTFSP